ncbi:MAG: hypothetical protein WCV56_07795 [Candidatus Omnitrophota bacterium]
MKKTDAIFSFYHKFFSAENRVRMVVALAFLSGLFFHFRNLEGARLFDPDEERAYAMLPSGPFIYVLCRPLFLLMHSAEYSGFYTAGIFGLGSIILFYLISRSLMDKWTSAICTLVFAVFPARINFARTLFPAVFLDFFILLLMLLAIYIIREKDEKKAVLAGLLSIILFAIHPSAYLILSGGWTALIVLWLFNREKVGVKSIVIGVVLYILGVTAGYFLLEQVFMRMKDGYVFSEKFLKAYSSATNYADIYSFWGGFRRFFGILKGIIFQSPITIFRGFFVCAAVIFSFKTFFEKRKPPLFYLIVYGCAGLGAFIAGNLIGAHRGFEYRNMIWLCPVVSWCVGYTCVSLFRKSGLTGRIFVSGLTWIFLISSFFISYLVTTEMFRTDMITDWLKKNNIPKSQVTTYLRLKEEGDTVFNTVPPIARHKEWSKTDHRYQIFWPAIYEYYRRGGVSYIIPSGTGGHATLEKGDIFFERASPVMSWEHPHTAFKYRSPYWGRPDRSYKPVINVYRLSDVFRRTLP